MKLRPVLYRRLSNLRLTRSASYSSTTKLVNPKTCRRLDNLRYIP
jgi:hypothetical protein